jgi:hypothetical protein
MRRGSGAQLGARKDAALRLVVLAHGGAFPGAQRPYHPAALRTQSRHKSFKIIPSNNDRRVGSRRTLSPGGFCGHFHK